MSWFIKLKTNACGLGQFSSSGPVVLLFLRLPPCPYLSGWEGLFPLCLWFYSISRPQGASLQWQLYRRWKSWWISKKMGASGGDPSRLVTNKWSGFSGKGVKECVPSSFSWDFEEYGGLGDVLQLPRYHRVFYISAGLLKEASLLRFYKNGLLYGIFSIHTLVLGNSP